MIVEVDGENTVVVSQKEQLLPLDDPMFVTFLKDYKAFKPFVNAYTASEEDREKWNLQICYQEQYISGSFLWNKYPDRRWSNLNDIWVTMAGIYRETMTCLNEEIQGENISS